MDYYRKAAAVFILVLTLILPLFLKVEKETAVVNLDKIVEESSYINQFLNTNSAQNNLEDLKNDEALEKELFMIIREAASKLAAENNYSSIIIEQPVYKGGKNISLEVAEKIDEINR